MLTLPTSLPSTTGIMYTLAGPVPNGGTIIVNATVEGGYILPIELPKGWTRLSDTTAFYTVTTIKVDCPATVAVDHAECINGAVSSPSVTKPANTSKIHYVKSGNETPGGTVTIVATLQFGYSWSATRPFRPSPSP